VTSKQFKKLRVGDRLLLTWSLGWTYRITEFTHRNLGGKVVPCAYVSADPPWGDHQDSVGCRDMIASTPSCWKKLGET
jgi:hypothetical protein